MRKKDPRKQQAIYRAVLSSIRHKGLNEMSMAEIAEKADIATGTLYIYFKSKEDLIREMYEDLIIERDKVLSKSYDLQGSFEIAFEEFWFTYLEHLLEHVDELRFIRQYQLLNKADTTGDSEPPSFEGIHQIIRKGISIGKVDKGPTGLMITMIVKSLEELVLAYSNEEVVLDKEGISRAYQMSVQSLLSG